MSALPLDAIAELLRLRVIPGDEFLQDLVVYPTTLSSGASVHWNRCEFLWDPGTVLRDEQERGARPLVRALPCEELTRGAA